MPAKTKILGIFAILIILLLMGAQCGLQSGEPAAPAAENVTVEATAEHEHAGEDHAHEAEAAAEFSPVSLAAGEKLKVVAANSIVADMVKNVAGDLVELTFLIPLGSDPHSFQATPQDVANVAEAHVFFANGLGLEEFLSELIENAGGKVVVVSLSTEIEEREGREGDEAYDHGSVDPHTWTTPANAIVFVHNIEQTLSALDPANAETYQANAEAYEAELAELDAWVKSQIETIPAENRQLVTDHAIFGYYADRYGLEQIGAVIPSFSTAAELSAQELAKLEDVIKEQGVKAIFIGNTVNPGLEQRVAEDTGIQLVTLYTESLGPEGSGVETYVDYIRYNTQAIVEALK
ncbi:MAG TPA: zinc ABC transporter substrate-binding protein [Anaerolineae bacterium]|nr:zinc ABC transporter substrate-binding protein [Anaerolineae bacterium]